MRNTHVLAGVMLVCVGIASLAFLNGNQAKSLVSPGLQGLTDREAADLAYMREEEKLARDVYQELYEAWGLQVFANIAASEETHTDAVRRLIERYGVQDPVVNDARGVFADPLFSVLYADLVGKGKESINAALAVGAHIEELDIADIQARHAATERADIRTVYEHLMRGSRNHLRAFSEQLTSRGGIYVPVHLTQKEYSAIIASERERGGGGWE